MPVVKKYLLSKPLLDQIRRDHDKMKGMGPAPTRPVYGKPTQERLFALITAKYIAGSFSAAQYPAEAAYSARQVWTDSAGDYVAAVNPLVWGNDADSNTLPPLLDTASLGPYNVGDTFLQRIPTNTVVEVFNRGRADNTLQWYCDPPPQRMGADFQADLITDGSGVDYVRVPGGQVLFGSETTTLATPLERILATDGYVYLTGVVTSSGTGSAWTAPTLTFSAIALSAYDNSSANALTRRILVGIISGGKWSQAHVGAANLEPPIDWVVNQGYWATVDSETGTGTYEVTMVDEPQDTVSADEANGITGISIGQLVWVTFDEHGKRFFVLGGLGGADEKVKADSGDPVAGYLNAKVQHAIEVDETAHKLQLKNDVASPGNHKGYATDGSGVHGWFAKVTPGTGISVSGDTVSMLLSSLSAVTTLVGSDILAVQTGAGVRKITAADLIATLFTLIVNYDVAKFQCPVNDSGTIEYKDFLSQNAAAAEIPDHGINKSRRTDVNGDEIYVAP